MAVAVKSPPGIAMGEWPRDIELSAEQGAFVLSEAHSPALFGGRGSGKTFAGMIKMINYIVKYPGALGVITQPSFPAVKKVFLPMLRSIIGDLEGDFSVPLGWQWKEAEKSIVFPRLKVTVWCRPADEDIGTKGTSIAFGWMDEISDGHQHESYLILDPSIRQQNFPPQLWVTSTPDRRRPWIKWQWNDHVNPLTGGPLDEEDFPYWYADTDDNLHLDEKTRRHWHKLYGDTALADEQLRGRFIQIEGAGYPSFDRPQGTHVRWPPVGMTFKRKLIGLDFGATAPTAAYEVGVDQGDRVWVLQEFYQRNADDAAWVSAVSSWGVNQIFCDPSRSKRDIETLQRIYGLPIRAARSNSFDLRFRLFGGRLAVRADGEPGMYITPACPNLIAEIPNLGLHKARGMLDYEDGWMPGTADHGWTSVCYALEEIDAGPAGMPKSPYKFRWGHGWRH